MSELLPVQFRGLDEGADAKSQPPGTLLTAKNCAMDKARRLTKRKGTTALSKTRFDSGSISAGARLIPSPGGGVVMSDGSRIYGKSAQFTSWHPIEQVAPLSVASRGLVDGGYSVGAADIVIQGDLLITAYALGDPSGVYTGSLCIKVTSVATGTTLLESIPDTASEVRVAPRVFVNGAGTVAYIVWVDRLKELSVRSITLSTLTVSSRTALTSDAGYTVLDACIGTSTAGEVILIGYELDAGATRVQLRSYVAATLVADQTANMAGVGATAISLAFGTASTKFYMAYSAADLNDTRLSAFSKDLAWAYTTTVEAADEAGATFVAEISATLAVVGMQYQETASRAYAVSTWRFSVSTGVLETASQRYTPHLLKPSKPWGSGATWYFAALHAETSYTATGSVVGTSGVVMKVVFTDPSTTPTIPPHVHVATLHNQTAWVAIGGQAKPAYHTVGDTTTTWIPSARKLREPVGYGDPVGIGWDAFEVSAAETLWTHPDSLRGAQVGAGVLLANGAPLWLDGLSAKPYGYASAPKILQVVATAGGSMVVGTYSYTAVRVWIDANGIKHRSAPSPPATGSASGGDLSLTVYVASEFVSNKLEEDKVTAASRVYIELYRTTVGGTVHYLMPQPFANVATTYQTSFVDTFADADVSTSAGSTVILSTQPAIYTETGELADVPPPALLTVATHRGRLVGIDATGRTLWFSKDHTEDPQIAPGFNEALVLSFASDKVALASLDEKLVVFGEHTIDLVHGAGPDATGAGEWQVQGVQTDVGCINPRSVVIAPMGVLFESSRGIEMLSRDLTVSWVGKAIEDTLASYPDITSATLCADAHEVRFTCNTGDAGSGIVLAWDYLHGIWFTRTYADAGNSIATDIPFVDACLVAGVYTMLAASGQVYQESASSYLDVGTTYVARDIVLAWMSPSGSPMAWHRVKDAQLLGTSVSNHDLTVSVAYDYAAAYGQTVTFAAQGDATTVGPLERCRVTLATQKCRAVKLRIQDTTPTTGSITSGAGPIWEGVAFRVQTKSGPAKTSSGRQG